MEAGYIPVSGAGGGGGSATAAPPGGSVIRAPGLKRGKMEEAISDRIKLESVLGLTVSSNAALDCDPATELVAYPAGCTVVLFNQRKNRQTHVLNASRKSVTCVAFSPDGRYLATGECGHAPAVRVWDLQDPSAAAAAVQVAEFPGHTHGVCCAAFSMSSKYLVSVGSQHDMIVNVWDWKNNLKLASNKVSSRVMAVSFAENGNYFVTVGFRLVKFWYLEYSRNAKSKEPVPLMGRSAILGEQKDNEFCDVRCGRGDSADSTYAITRSGLLCQFNSRRLLDKWLELRTTSANCMSIGANYIFVGCADGIIRCFSPSTLQYVTTLPRPHYLGIDVSQGRDIRHMFSPPAGARYPDAVALTYDERNHKLTCVYNDHSLYVWDIRDIKKVGKTHSALYHSACIWGVDMVGADTSPLPPGCFLTCSSDDTVRYWNLKPPHDGQFASNIYSKELQKVIYIDPELKFLKDVDLTAPSEKDKTKSYDDKTGVRCVRVSPDGQHLASGDRAGNIWVHAAATGHLVHTLEAHDAEVLCLEYSEGRPRLLASASRDRLIHVFQVDKGYQIMQTLDDHSSSITAVRFISSAGGLQMVSCGADKTILFRQLVTSPEGGYQFERGANVSGRTTLYDMEVDAGGRHVLAACQDRNVRVYSAQHQRHTKTFRGTRADEGTLIKVALDSSGIYLATSSTDKLLSVYDYYSGECMATMYGHSEIVTGLRFTPDCQHLVSASGDGCIFVWRVPHDMVVTMRARLAQQAIRQGRKVGVSTNGLSGLDSETDSHFGSPPRELPNDSHKMAAPQVPDYTLRIGHLPSWAKKSLGDELHTGGGGAGDTPAPEPPARSKWARRLNAPNDDKRDSDGSKDSSLDSGTDTRYIEKRKEQIVKQRPRSLNFSQLSNVEALFRNFDASIKKTYDVLTISPRSQKVTIVTKPRVPELRVRHHTDDSSLGSFKYEDQESTEHDGDVEDISDGERTSSERNASRTTYYPGNGDTTPGEFTVNAMDVEELRASQRRSKRWKQDKARLQLPLAATSVSGSGQDSSEDDEVSTPSGDNAERNPLSGSCESLDTAGRRELFLRSAYDSLSGAELDTTLHAGNTSLSSQHILSVRSPPAPARPAPVPAASPSASHTPASAAPSPAPRSPAVDAETARRREELNRRIRETRRQLANVTYSEQSGLKSSQSTTDLSYYPEKGPNSRPTPQGRIRPVSMAVPNSSRPYGAFDTNPSLYADEQLDSLNSNNFFDSLNYSQNANTDYRNRNPYAIPANLNHRLIPEYGGNNYLDSSVGPYVPPHSNILMGTQNDRRTNMHYTQYQNKPMVFKEQMFPQAVNLDSECSMDIEKHSNPASKVFDRLFPSLDNSDIKPHKEAPPIAPKNFHLNLTKATEDVSKPQQKLQKPNSFRSIFKNYKSCPVSPVSEECKWADKIAKQKASNPANQTNDLDNVIDPRKRNSLCFFVGPNSNSIQDNGKSIVDTIKSDTEKMIAEITKKYGNLDDYDPKKSQTDDLDMKPTKEINYELEDGNFSSDSLEDCSLSQDASCKNKLFSKKVCRKHTKNKGLPRRSISNYEICSKDVKPVIPAKPSFITNQKSSTLPRNMPSNLDDIMDEDYNTNPNASMYRCQSVLTKRCVTRSNESILSDNSNGSSVSNEIFMKYGNQSGFQQTKIYDSHYNINDSQNCSFENINDTDQINFDRHRHSSASFFLNQRKYMESSCSQESILSDETCLDHENQVLSRTNCNSLESVLSDESEYTKSAPLEMLFEGAKIKLPRQSTHDNSGMSIPRNSKSCYEFDNTSKSYGSSPNNAPSFSGYLYNNYLGQSVSPKFSESPIKQSQSSMKQPANKVYGFDIPVPVSQPNPHKAMSRSKSLYDSSTKATIAKNIAFFIDGTDMKPPKPEKKKSDEIPRLSKADYKANTSKSLQTKCVDKYKYVTEMEGCEKSMIKSKSCSFEVVLEPASKPNPLKSLKEKRSSHVKKNLEKFEEQIRKNTQSKFIKNQTNKEKTSSATSKYNNNTKSLERGSVPKNDNSKITMEFVPHKPPKPVKRTSSVKLNNRYKANLEKSSAGSTISSLYKAKLDGLPSKNFLESSMLKKDDNSNKLDSMSDNTEKTFDVFVKEKDINENRSEIQMDSLEVLANQRLERLKQVSVDSLEILDMEDSTDNFAKDSLDYYFGNENKLFINSISKEDDVNVERGANIPQKISHSNHKPLNLKNDNIALTAELEEEIKKFKYIERKIEIINKLVEMEERKILQEKYLKEWRMKPLEANIDNGNGVVKVLSRKFEKLALNDTPLSNFTSQTLEEADTYVDSRGEIKDIKRNLSLPDILDSDQIEGLATTTSEDYNNEWKNNPSANDSTDKHAEELKKEDSPEVMTLNNAMQIADTGKSVQKCLQQRVYNVMVIPKTDIHIDSENYESSTTSSSCANSPKHLSIFGSGKSKTTILRRPMIRGSIPRPCNMGSDYRYYPALHKVRPVISSIGPSHRCPTSTAGSVLAKRIQIQPPMQFSKFSSASAASRGHATPQYPDEDVGMRRAISLSDLAVKPSPAPRTQVHASGKLPSNSGVASKPARPPARYASKSSMTRSSSVGVLNQSDSESDGAPSARGGGGGAAGVGAGAAGGARAHGLMRPTISSQNKAAAAAARRRPLQQAYSSVNLTSAGQEESSSEAEGKPAAPPRPRAVSIDHAQRRIGRSGSERDLSAKAREVTARLAGGGGGGGAGRSRHDSRGERSPTDAQLSTALCAALTEQLTQTAGKVVRLYRSLQHEPRAADDTRQLISGLEAAILETQKVLRGAVQRQGAGGGGVGGAAGAAAAAPNGRSNGADTLSSLSSTEGERCGAGTGAGVEQARRKLEELLAKGAPNMAEMEQFSDVLLTLMQSKVVNEFQNPQHGQS